MLRAPRPVTGGDIEVRNAEYGQPCDHIFPRRISVGESILRDRAAGGLARERKADDARILRGLVFSVPRHAGHRGGAQEQGGGAD